MKLYGAINDGYRFIYSIKKFVIEDWIYIHQENFCILKVFEIEVPETTQLIKNSDLIINFKFDKREIKQEKYISVNSKEIGIIFKNGLGLISLIENNKLEKEITKIYLSNDEQVILIAARNLVSEKEKKWH